MLVGNNVVDLEGQRKCKLGNVTVFTALTSSFPNGPSQFSTDCQAKSDLPEGGVEPWIA